MIRDEWPHLFFDSELHHPNDARYVSGQDQFDVDTKTEKFLEQFNVYRDIYEKLETKRRRDLKVRLLDIGKQVRCGGRSWIRHDLEEIAAWKGLPASMLMMDDWRDFECRLESALRIEDKSSRVSALCDIRGMGPILASTVSMFTWPDTYGFMDHHTNNALRLLGFNFPRKHYTTRFTTRQLLTYLEIVRSLGGTKRVSSMEIAEALCALDRAITRNNRRENDALSQLLIMVDGSWRS